MKICYISASIIPSKFANSVHVMKMSNAFSKNGHECILIAKSNNKNDKQNHIFTDYAITSPFKLKLMKLVNIKGSHYIYSLKAALYARSLKPELIFCRDLFGAFISSLLNQKVIFESHAPIEQSTNKIMSAIKRKIFHLLIQKINFIKLVVITESLKEFYINNYKIPASKILVCPDGADKIKQNIQANPLIAIGNNRPQIGYVGHLYPGKGMEIISKTAILCPQADFHIVGGSEKDIAYWKTTCKNAENIIFHGFVAHDKITAFLKAFDIVLLPNQKRVQIGSKQGSEIGEWTSPLKLFEYMSAAKAIVASDIPVLKEILHHRKNAILCNPQSPEEWAVSITMLWSDSKQREALAKQAFLDFEDRYSWEKRAEFIINSIQ